MIAQKTHSFLFKHPNWTLILLAAVQFIYVMDFMIIMPLGSHFMEEWRIGADKFGLLISGFAVAGGISSFIASFFLDKFERKTLLCWVFALFTLGIWASAFAPNYFLLLSARIFTGLFGGLLGAIILAIIGDRYAYSDRSKAISFTTIGLASASIMGVPLGIYLANQYSWRATFIFLSMVSSVVLCLLYFFLSPQKNKLIASIKKVSIWHTFFSFLKEKAPRLGLLFSIAIVFSQYTIFIYLAPYLVNNVGLEEGDLTYIYLIGGISTIIAAPLIGRLSDRYGKKRSFILLSGFLIIPIIALTMTPLHSFQMILFISIFYFALDSGRMIPVNALLTQLVGTQQRARYLSLRSSVKKLATGLTGVLGGLIIQTDSKGSLQHFELMGLIAIFSLITATLLVSHTKA